MKFHIRKIIAHEIDDCIQLFQETVHHINVNDYTQHQLDASAPLIAPKQMDNYDYWLTLTDNFTFVAIDNETDKILGFGDMTKYGYLDRLYVHKNFQRCGIAAGIYSQLEHAAKQHQLIEIVTHASITAKAFFEKMGFQIEKIQQVTIRQSKLTNFIMKKKLTR